LTLGVSIKKPLLLWLTLFRLGATARGVLPFLLGAVIAWSQGNPINWLILLLSTIAVICVMLMTFLVNEYYDYEVDIANKNYHLFSGGSRILPMGLIPRRHAIIAAYIFTIIAAGIGLWLYFGFKTGHLTIPLGAAAIIIGYFYTASPVRLSYRGWGEVSIWFTCGWLATITGYYLQAGQLNTVTTLVSLPGAFGVFLVILINEIPDIKSDKLSGKNNLAVRLGIEKAGILYIILLILCYVSIIVIVFFGVPVISTYLSFIPLVLAIWMIRTIYKKGLSRRDVQESLSMRTIVFDHLITVIYIICFIVAGFSAGEVNISHLIMLGAAFIIVFGLEGLGIICPRMLFPE
jgi:1,4-dihydroxy-2-naphthoate octaprenyltransferase